MAVVEAEQSAGVEAASVAEQKLMPRNWLARAEKSTKCRRAAQCPVPTRKYSALLGVAAKLGARGVRVAGDRWPCGARYLSA